MALFSSISEIRKYLPINVTFTFSDIEPFVKQAERDFLIPVLSQAQYDEIEAAQTSSDPDIQKLLDKSRAVVAPYALQLWIPFGQAQITSGGIQITSNENSKTAFQWQIEGMENTALLLAYSCAEDLIKFLLVNKTTYTAWTASDEYARLFRLFINTATEFNEYFEMGTSRYLFLQLIPTIQRVEKNSILPILCKELFDEIKAEILSGSISPENEALLNFIKPAVANLTIKNATGELLLRIERYTATTLIGQQLSRDQGGTQDERNSRLSMLRNEANTEADSQLKQLSDYLYANKDTYPSWSASACYVAPVDPTTIQSSNNGCTSGLYSTL